MYTRSACFSSRVLRDAGFRHCYVSNLPNAKAVERLDAITELVDAG